MQQASFTDQDLDVMRAKGIDPELAAEQIRIFERGVPFASLDRPATIGDGIQRPADDRFESLLATYQTAQDAGRAMKFVPASGAASRMFKALFQALQTFEEGQQPPKDHDFHTFAEHLERFAFYSALKSDLAEAGHDLDEARARGDWALILRRLLHSPGLNYGAKPKALLIFHQRDIRGIMPLEEHMAEAKAHIQDTDGKARLHFTVSKEHQREMELMVEVIADYGDNAAVNFQVGYSIQKPCTDTIAVTPENQPFRDAGDAPLFRPGGHGALLENLNDLKGDLIFIKNIDNVVPTRLQGETISYKKLLGGVLVDLQQRIHQGLEDLEAKEHDEAALDAWFDFLAENLGYQASPEERALSREDKQARVIRLLDRPIRVCGMVRNQGEPGGGPFWVTDENGARTLQIVEGAQIDKSDDAQKAILDKSTHFNPVDLVCAVRDRHGRAYDLTRFRDEKACFISEKSKDGRSLKALELPGLWNGAMADWNTAFVEVPLITFNPVKTVLDLLRDEHQA